MKEVLKYGSELNEPVMIRLSESFVLLQYDTKSLFVNHHGKIVNQDSVISWTGVPKQLGNYIEAC